MSQSKAQRPVDEFSRLLPHRPPSFSDEEAQNDPAPSPTPLPWPQLAVLAIMRISEPIAFLCIMPFIPQMLQDNMPDVPPEQIGYYAGYIESSFALVQFCTVFMWGRVSDRIGRKPVLLIGLCGVFISMNCFGLAKTMPQMMLARVVAGFANGNLGVMKALLGEITDETNQARAFSYLPICYSLGALIGPAIGGSLSDPVQHIPIFRHSEFLKEYPYWLPCFCASLFNLVSIVTGYFLLQETLPSQSSRDRENTRNSSPSLREILTPSLVTALTNAGMTNFVNICYIGVLPVFAHTPLQSGGLSLSTQEIGYYLGFNGIVIIAVQLFVFPRLERYLGGPLPTLRKCLTFLPFVFVGFALAHFAGKEWGKGAMLTCLVVILLTRGASSMMLTASNLCMLNLAPSRAALGSINGLQQSLSCLARAIGPVFANTAFAYSISEYKHILDGQAVWIVMTAIALLTWYTSARMSVPKQAEWRSK